MKEGWTYKPLGEIATFIKDGDWIESKDQSESGIRLIQTGNVGYGIFKIKDDKPHYITEETMARLGCTEIFEGDCLVSRLPNPVGRACLIPDIGYRMITAVDCSIIRFGKDYLPQFFVYYTQSYKYLNSIDEKTTGTTRKRISRKNLEKIQIPVPPISEQERIVERLDAAFAQIDELKSNAERQLAEARALFQSALTQAMQPKPGWQEKTLPDISENLDSIRVPITKKNRTTGIYPYYGASGIVDYVDDYLFDEDLLCISEDGANLLMRTYPIAFPIFGKAWVNNHAHVLRFKNLYTQKYVEYYFESIKLDEFITGAAQPKLTQKALNSIIIPLPLSLDEQKSIIYYLNSLSSRIIELEEISRKTAADCDAMKQALLRQIFE